MKETGMEIKLIDQRFSVCKVNSFDKTLLEDEFCFVGKTDEELSLVCLTEHAPADAAEREDGWKAMRIQGVLDFSLIGILAPIATILAENKIGIFAVSTYNTDYILVKEDCFNKAADVLEGAGYKVIRQS